MSKLFSKNVSSWGVASNINRCKTMGSIANGQRVIMLLLELYDVYPALKNLSIKQRYSEISSALGINERTIRRTCEMLCDHGFLHKENNIKTSDKDKTKKEYQSNTWYFTSKLILRYWKTWADFNEINEDILPVDTSNLMIKEQAQMVLDHVLNTSAPPMDKIAPPMDKNDHTLWTKMTIPMDKIAENLGKNAENLGKNDHTLLREKELLIKIDASDKVVLNDDVFCLSDAHIPRWDHMRNLLKDEIIHLGDRPLPKLTSNWPDAPENYKINQEMGYCNHQAMPKKFNDELSRQCKIIRALNSEKVLLLRSQIDMSLQNFKGKLSQAERDLIVNATTIPVNQKLFIHGSKAATEHIAVGIMKYALYQMDTEDERRFGCPSMFFGSFEYLAQLKKQLYDRYVKQNNYAVDVKVDILVENVEYMIIYHHSNQSNKFLQHLHNDIDEIIKIRPQMNFIICSTSKINQCSKVIQENFKSIEIK